MPYNGAGIFTLPTGNPVVTGTVISSSWANNTLSDIANNGLSNCITKDGQTTPTANIPLGGFRLTGVAAAVDTTDAVNAGQLQAGTMNVLSAVGGTGDAITAVASPAPTALVAGMRFVYTPVATNTLSNPTINIAALGAKTITRSDGVGLWAGALVVGTPYELVYDGTNFRVQSGILGNQIVPMGSPFAFRNRFVDGNFDFWDAGPSVAATAGGNYVSSAWGYAAGTGGTATASQTAFAAGAEPAGMTTPARFYMQVAQTVGGSTAPAIFQRLESVGTFEGKSATLSVWMWVASGTLSVTNIGVNQVFGSGGSASVVTNTAVSWTLTTTPQRFSVRLDIPSISGKTIGTSDYLSIAIGLPQSTTFTVNIAQAQIEDCPSDAPSTGLPTPFELHGYGAERSILNRYFSKINCSFRATAGGAGTTFESTIAYSQMRIAPAATLLSAGSSSNLSSQSIVNPSSASARFRLVSAAAGDCFALDYIYIFDARL
jgi:hypothetical protein